MPRPSTVVAGKSRTFYLSVRQRIALARFRERKGHRSDAEAMREVLDTLADVEGLPTDPGECLALHGSSPELT